MHLVIVESPAKGRTIEKYLGKDYKVLASFGHVRDLPKSKLGVDVEHNFEPSYIVPTKAKKVVTQLKNELKKSDMVFLATDYDREGEAIAWHIANALSLDTSKTDKVQRITFHEITKEAITNAVKHPRALDMNLIDAQQARRVLDRLVGYKLSPFLWKKVYTGLSAGRVQSVAVRLIVDREREILAFQPVEYWSIEADLLADKTLFTASLVSRNGEKIEKMTVKTAEEAEAFRQDLEQATYTVVTLTTKNTSRQPYPPFTTSTLQQTASHQLGFSAKRTMALAQGLYEAGHITYMRTDSVNLSDTAINGARTLITKEFGEKYLEATPRRFKTKSKGAQEAHEAIRPTDPLVTPEQLGAKIEPDQLKLYTLIWKRLIACQMVAATFEQIAAEIDTNGTVIYRFRATGQRMVFDGFLKLWPDKTDSKILPVLTEGQKLKLDKLRNEQHFTEPPPRFNEASLIKTLEEYGIGRPSTYAPTISTIVDRGYVRIDNRQFTPQEVGFIVTDLMKEHFPNIVDVQFTAHLEEDLDSIAEGEKNWVSVIDTFYQPFAKLLAEKEQSVEKRKTEEATDQICELCGKPMVIKLGRFGRFLACTGFPECKNTKPILKTIGIICPECGQAELAERTTKRRRKFWGCSRYPECKYATWDDPLKPKNPDDAASSDTTPAAPPLSPEALAADEAAIKANKAAKSKSKTKSAKTKKAKAKPKKTKE